MIYFCLKYNENCPTFTHLLKARITYHYKWHEKFHTFFLQKVYIYFKIIEKLQTGVLLFVKL